MFWQKNISKKAPSKCLVNFTLGFTQHDQPHVEGDQDVHREVQEGKNEVPQRVLEESFEAIKNYLMQKLKGRSSGCVNVFGDCGNYRPNTSGSAI
jgi:hypothetical protein